MSKQPSDPQPIEPSGWYGDQHYFGLHYDLHASAKDTDLGERADPETLIPLLKLADVDWVQTDCKGHPGYTSWYSQVSEASVSPGVMKDAMAGWRAATQQLDLKLHCHYSGILDGAAALQHPEWTVLDKDAKRIVHDPGMENHGVMAPLGPYVEQLLIPQMIELIDRYKVDGFWVDGEVWAVRTDYDERAVTAFRDATGIDQPPRDPADPNWNQWMAFTRQTFYDYVTRYCEAIHAHKPDVRICSNWLQTFRNPGEPKVPTDWVSGDNSPVFGLDASRYEARFISTRGKHWDIMLWSFYKLGEVPGLPSAWAAKPVQMLQQEAAITLALGGAVQLYEHPTGLRNGQLVPWRMERFGEVAAYVKARRELCQHTETIAQVAVLHSEHHYYTNSPIPFPDSDQQARPVKGSTYALLENHYGVDLLDEWAMLSSLDTFPLIVAAEQNRMSDEMVEALKAYVEHGGCLLVSGAAAYERFGAAFLGVQSTEVERECTYCISTGVDPYAAPVYSADWRRVVPTQARAFGKVGTSELLDERLIDAPAATINTVGRGKVAYVPFGIFDFFARAQYPLLRQFIGALTHALVGELPIRVTAPTCVDVVLRRKDSRTIVHFINRISGIPNHPGSGAVDEIPNVGPITLNMTLDREPGSVTLAFEDAPLHWTFQPNNDHNAGTLSVTLERLHIHASVVITD